MRLPRQYEVISSKTSPRQWLERLAEWAARLILLPLAILSSWFALRELFFAGPVGVHAAASAVGLAWSGLLLYAALYPAPPWGNEPLRAFCSVLLLVIGVALWWVATLAIAWVLIAATWKDMPLQNVAFLVAILVLVWAQVKTYGYVTARWRRWRQRSTRQL